MDEKRVLRELEALAEMYLTPGNTAHSADPPHSSGNRDQTDPEQVTQDSPGEDAEPLADVQVVLVGHLPGFAGPWIAQYADELAERHGPAVICHVEPSLIELEVVRPNPSRRPMMELNPPTESQETGREDRSLRGALHELASQAAIWLIHLPDPLVDGARAIARHTRHWTVLTGADEAAVVGAYRLLKRAVRGWPEELEQRQRPRVDLMFMGCDQASALGPAQRIRQAADKFLSLDTRLFGVRRQMQPVAKYFVGSFTNDDDPDAVPPWVTFLSFVHERLLAGADDEDPSDPVTEALEELASEPSQQTEGSLSPVDEAAALDAVATSGSVTDDWVALDAAADLVDAYADAEADVAELNADVEQEEAPSEPADEADDSPVIAIEYEDASEVDEWEQEPPDREYSWDDLAAPTRQTSNTEPRHEETEQSGESADEEMSAGSPGEEPDSSAAAISEPEPGETNEMTWWDEPVTSGAMKTDFAEQTVEPVVEQEAAAGPGQLAEYLPNVTALSVGCPLDSDIQLGADNRGRLHLMTHATGEQAVAAVGRLLVVSRWAAMHGSLLSSACQACQLDAAHPPRMHLFTDQPRRVASLLAGGAQEGAPLELHALLPVTVGQITTYAYVPIT